MCRDGCERLHRTDLLVRELEALVRLQQLLEPLPADEANHLPGVWDRLEDLANLLPRDPAGMDGRAQLEVNIGPAARLPPLAHRAGVRPRLLVLLRALVDCEGHSQRPLRHLLDEQGPRLSDGENASPRSAS